MSVSNQRWILLFLILAGLFSSEASASNCSRSDVDYYLEKGFTPAQIVDLCGAKPGASVDQAPETGTSISPNAPPSSKMPNEQMHERVLVESAIDAESVQVTPEAIEFIQDRCLPYGKENDLELQPRACLVMQTRIARNSLQVVDAAEPSLLSLQGSLTLKGQIEREILDRKKVRQQDLTRFFQTYPARADYIEVPLKRGFSRKQLAKAFAALAIQPEPK